MEDDHVDRPGVEVRQRMKLTGTNSSIGLIVLIDCAHQPKADEVNRQEAVGTTTAFAHHKHQRRVQKNDDNSHCCLMAADYCLIPSFSNIKLRFADLVVMAGWLHPFPFRTRP